MKTIKKDVLIIGAGLAGLYTALNITKDLEIGVLSKDELHINNSSLAQGGIAAKINEEDTFEQHVADTLNAGGNANRIDAVELLVKNAPEEIHQLIDYGVEFDTDENGMILTTLEGGHSRKRVLHVNGDATGKAIMDIVSTEALQRKNIQIMVKSMAIEILMNGQKVDGVYAISNGELVYIETSTVVIATGGIGAMYLNTTNQMFSTGDGIALANSIHCKISNPCFVQFHPTAFYSEQQDTRFLITEALRGEGAMLLDGNKKRFMDAFDERGELAPRDIVSRGIYKTMRKQELDHVWLDITMHEKAFLEKRFPTIFAYLEKRGIDMSKDYIPVAPVSHYFVGGIRTDLYGQTTVHNIYACGEVSSTGVHGANRLASNSLLECVVFGRRCATHINKKYETSELSSFEAELQEAVKVWEKEIKHKKARWEAKFEELQEVTETIEYTEEKKKIRKLMTNYAGIVRRNDEVTVALGELEDILIELEKKKCFSIAYFEVINMCNVAILIMKDARDQESIGCHYKEGEKVNL